MKEYPHTLLYILPGPLLGVLILKLDSVGIYPRPLEDYGD